MFPNVSAFIAPEITQIAQLFPGPTPDKNRTVLNYLRRDPIRDDEDRANVEAAINFFRDVTYNEDYLIGLEIQKGLESGAQEDLIFGKNERGRCNRAKAGHVNRISLASGVVPEFGPVDTIEAAAEGGFDAVGLWIEPENWTAGTTRDCRTALADRGLELLDVEVIWLKPDSDMRQHKAVIDIGAELG
eukprot:gene36342-59427_t